MTRSGAGETSGTARRAPSTASGTTASGTAVPTAAASAAHGRKGQPMLKADATGPLRPPAPRGPLADPPAPDLGAMDLGALRALRRDAQREEADLSYLRRMLHGRIDILHAELARRGCPERPETGPAQGGEGGGGSADGAPAGGAVGAGVAGSGSAGSGSGGPGTGGPGTAGADAPVVDRLPEILTDGPSRVRSSARHVTLGTPLTERVRLLAEEMLSEVELSDLDARTDPELDAAMARLARHEQQVSRRRQTLQRTVDGCSAEITRRYRTGEAHVEDLLTES